MDEFHISPSQIVDISKALEKLIKVTKEAAKQAKKLLNAYFGVLEPYQLYEMRHPKKKPRGSIRRKRRYEREKKRTGLTGVNMFVDDIYDIMAIEDNKRG